MAASRPTRLRWTAHQLQMRGRVLFVAGVMLPVALALIVSVTKGPAPLFWILMGIFGVCLTVAVVMALLFQSRR